MLYSIEIIPFSFFWHSINQQFAEDDLFIKLYLEEILKEIPVSTIRAQNGQEVVDLFRQHENISLILMDLRMPKLSGMQAAKEILKLRPEAKIIAQTANAIANDREICLKNGFVDYITKPLDKNKLFQLIKKWIQ